MVHVHTTSESAIVNPADVSSCVAIALRPFATVQSRGTRSGCHGTHDHLKHFSAIPTMGLGDKRPERIALHVGDWSWQQSKKLSCHGRLPCADRTGKDRDAHANLLDQMGPVKASLEIPATRYIAGVLASLWTGKRGGERTGAAPQLRNNRIAATSNEASLPTSARSRLLGLGRVTASSHGESKATREYLGKGD